LWRLRTIGGWLGCRKLGDIPAGAAPYHRRVARCRTVQRVGSVLVAALITGLITAAALV